MNNPSLVQVGHGFQQLADQTLYLGERPRPILVLQQIVDVLLAVLHHHIHTTPHSPLAALPLAIFSDNDLFQLDNIDMVNRAEHLDFANGCDWESRLHAIISNRKPYYLSLVVELDLLQRDDFAVRLPPRPVDIPVGSLSDFIYNLVIRDAVAESVDYCVTREDPSISYCACCLHLVSLHSASSSTNTTHY